MGTKEIHENVADNIIFTFIGAGDERTKKDLIEILSENYKDTDELRYQNKRLVQWVDEQVSLYDSEQRGLVRHDYSEELKLKLYVRGQKLTTKEG